MQLIKLSENMWANPGEGSIEMVYLETVNPEGQKIEEPFVVLGFRGAGGIRLPPTVKIDDVIDSLRMAESPQMVYNQTYLANDGLDTKGYIVIGLAIVIAVLLGALIF